MKLALKIVAGAVVFAFLAPRDRPQPESCRHCVQSRALHENASPQKHFTLSCRSPEI